MSKPRYDWWGYVKSMIRKYPRLREEYVALHNISLVPAYEEKVAAKNEIQRKIESLAIRELPSTKQREYEAVKGAVEITEGYAGGAHRIKLIRLVFWDKSHTLAGAALTIPCSMSTAKRWHGEFIRLVAKIYGLMDDDTLEPKK